LELDRPHTSKQKCNLGGGYGVEHTRTKEKRKAEEVAENDMRASPGYWKTWGDNKQLCKNCVPWTLYLYPMLWSELNDDDFSWTPLQ
jgi:hypothetical protein